MSNSQDMATLVANAVAAAMAAMQSAPVAATEEATTTTTPRKPRKKEAKPQQAPLPTKAPTGPSLMEGLDMIAPKEGRALYIIRHEYAANTETNENLKTEYVQGVASMLLALSVKLGDKVNTDFQYWGEIPLSGEIAEHLIPYAKAIKVEQKAQLELNKGKSYSNPSMPFKRMREKAMRPNGSGNRNIRAIDAVLKPDLEKLYQRAWQNQSDLGKEYRPLFEGLAALLKSNGVILATLHKKAEKKTPKK
jgi:hypothetical protein